MRSDLNSYTKLSDFTTDLDLKSNAHLHLPFKIMGQKKDATARERGIFYSASMLNVIYKDTPNPDSFQYGTNITAIFGTIYNRGCRLNNSVLFSSIVPHQKGTNQFQFDIFKIDSKICDVEARYLMLLSHSCEIDKTTAVLVAPVYLESDLKHEDIEKIKGSPSKDPSAVLQNWLKNESSAFLGLPATDEFNDDGLIVNLRFATVFPKGSLPTNPTARFKYRSMSYFQLRLAMLLARDVQDSDETRDF